LLRLVEFIRVFFI